MEQHSRGVGLLGLGCVILACGEHLSSLIRLRVAIAPSHATPHSRCPMLTVLRVVSCRTYHTHYHTYGRPEKLNAMNTQYWQDMRDCFGALDADPDVRLHSVWPPRDALLAASCSLGCNSLRRALDALFVQRTTFHASCCARRGKPAAAAGVLMCTCDYATGNAATCGGSVRKCLLNEQCRASSILLLPEINPPRSIAFILHPRYNQTRVIILHQGECRVFTAGLDITGNDSCK